MDWKGVGGNEWKCVGFGVRNVDGIGYIMDEGEKEEDEMEGGVGLGLWVFMIFILGVLRNY